MPKYILIGLFVAITAFLLMNYWPKLSDSTKNKLITSIFGIIAVGFVVLLTLLIF